MSDFKSLLRQFEAEMTHASRNPGLTIESRLERSGLCPTLAGHLWGQIPAVSTADVLGERPSPAHLQVDTESHP